MPDEDGFVEFWNQYPRKESKKDARKAWGGVSAPDRSAALTAIVAWAIVWVRQGREPQHIPLAGTWLRGERWEDELPRKRSVMDELTGKNNVDRGRIFDAAGDVRQSDESNVERLRSIPSKKCVG